MHRRGDTATIRPPAPVAGRLPGASDKRLLRRATAGDRDAFEAIFRRYHQDLYRYCLSVVRDPDEAQDALQNTITSALRSLPGEERDIELRPWLFRVAHNAAISILRARKPLAEPQVGEQTIDHAAAERVEDRERLRTLLGDLERLSEQRRAALTLRELSGLTFEQVAEVLSITPQAARQAVYEARVDLRDLERGREMDCEAVCQVISDGDRRALRGKRLRSHLRACSHCSDFRRAIDVRSADLAALAPPLPALAAAGLLQAALGSGAAGTAAAGAGAATAGGIGGGALALKSAASVVAASALAVGAADRAGLIELPLRGREEAPAPASSAPAEPGARGVAPAASRPEARYTGPPVDRAANRERGRDEGRERGRDEGRGRGPGGKNDRGQAPAGGPGANPGAANPAAGGPGGPVGQPGAGQAPQLPAQASPTATPGPAPQASGPAVGEAPPGTDRAPAAPSSPGASAAAPGQVTAPGPDRAAEVSRD